MPPKGIAKRRLSNEHQKRQEDIRNESSEDRQSVYITETTTTTAEESMAKQQSSLESNRFSNLQTKQSQISEQMETAMHDNKRQRMCELYQRDKATEAQDQPEGRLEQTLGRMSRLGTVETGEQHERILEQQRACDRPITASETPEQLERRLKCQRIRLGQIGTTETREQHEKTLEQTRARMLRHRVVEEEHKRTLECHRIRYRRMKEIEMPEELERRLKRMHLGGKPTRAAETPEERGRGRNHQPLQKLSYRMSRMSVQPEVFIKQEPNEYDQQRSVSADMVFKDEFVVSDEDYSGSSVLVPPSFEPPFHVIFSMVCIGSSQKLDNGQ
ncbi:hypothetical protein CDAR_442451 [Caerostris darwini]|uniref:Uncharacterized protein n=1 Tax=Caerostris darwini TaxID=1538125 RepID=A0AAV4V166_9ARAC|nr:hypothetical protein CDAR_442451 [Caerostris darwini]